MLGADKFAKPTARLRTSELPQQPHGRNHRGALLFNVKLRRKRLDLVIQRVMLFCIHFAHCRR